MGLLKKIKEKISENRAIKKRFKELDEREKKHFALIEADRIHEIRDEEELYLDFTNWFLRNRVSEVEGYNKKAFAVTIRDVNIDCA